MKDKPLGNTKKNNAEALQETTNLLMTVRPNEVTLLEF